MQGDVPHRTRDLFAAAAGQHRRGQLDEAGRLYRTILAIDPRHADALHLLGVIALQMGRHDEAVELITRAIAENGQAPSFYNNLGNAFRACGQREQAAVAFRHALAINPDSPDTLYNLGVVLQELGKLDEATAAYRGVIAARPDHAAACSNLGNILNTQGRFPDALECYEKALRMQAGFLPAIVNRGNVLKTLGRLDEAVQSYRRALALNPRSAEAYNNLGLALLEADRTDEAIAALQSAVSIHPDYAEAHRNLGNALRERGRAAESFASYRQALALDADGAEARLGLAMVSIPLFVDSVAQSAEVPAAFERALADLAKWNGDFPGRLGKAVGSTQPFYLAYRPYDIAVPLSRYGDLICQAAAAVWAPDTDAPAFDAPSTEARSAEVRSAGAARERIRVLIVCGHVRSRHPVWDILLRGILSHLNRERLEIFLYHTGSTVDDETLWAQSRVDRFVQGGRTTAAWIAEVRRDEPDIVFYPEVGMDSVACALAALRLAPCQVACWGHPVTTGLPTIDLYVSGELLESAQAGEHYREKLVRLPGTGACTRTPGGTALTWDHARAGSDVVRFALPHQPIKFDPADDILLTRIAKAVGDCEFWIASPAKLGWATDRLHARLADVFRREGLDPGAHLRVMPWLQHEQFLGFLDAMDVYLDCAAFSGYTTAWHAVHRGLPIVTLEGAFLRQRLAAGLLRQIGVEGVAQTQDHYVKLAVQFAEESRNLERRTARRLAIRQAANGAGENLEAIRALERVLIEAGGGSSRCG